MTRVVSAIKEEATSGGDYTKVDSILQEWENKKVQVLPTFSADMKLDATNYAIWKVTLEAVLETYDLVVMVDTEFPRLVESGVMFSEGRRAKIRKAARQWDRLNARIRSFIFLNCTTKVIGHIAYERGQEDHRADVQSDDPDEAGFPRGDYENIGTK